MRSFGANTLRPSSSKVIAAAAAVVVRVSILSREDATALAT